MIQKAHRCSPKCKEFATYNLAKLSGYNPLSKPLLCGWYRDIVKRKGKREILYKAPCGRFLRNMDEIHKYLMITQSDMTVDLFDFDLWVRCLAEFVLDSDQVITKDLSKGRSMFTNYLRIVYIIIFLKEKNKCRYLSLTTKTTNR